MAGAGVRIDLTVDDREIRASLDRLLKRLADPLPVLEEIGQGLITSTIDRFERERGPDKVSWKKSARAKKQGGQTLTDTGRLRASITGNVRSDGIEIGTNVVYAAIHQFGGEAGPRKRRVTLPARPYLGVDDEDRRMILRVVQRAIERAVG